MRAPGRIVGLALLAAAVTLGCKEEPRRAPAAAAGGGGGPTRPGSGGSDSTDDAGSEPSTDAAASLDGGERMSIWTQCEPVDPALVGGDELINAVTLPADLDVTRVETSWATCSDPTLRITLSDGSCPDGYGHELVLELGVDFFGTAMGIIVGQNEINPEGDNGIRVRYRRPDPLEPTGEWGSCAGSGGYVNFTDVPSSDRNALLLGGFQLTLTPCDEIAMYTQQVNGTFNVTLRRGLDEACASP